MAILDDPARADLTAPAQRGQVDASLRFEWVFSLLITWLVGGVFLDGWAHNHGKVGQSPFTPWHGLLYTGYGVFVAFLGYTLYANHQKGYSWRQAVPSGYGSSVVGAVLFALGGVADFFWHLVFGVELGIDGNISPSHLTLALGGVLMLSGPVRAAWQRRDYGAQLGWSALVPLLLALTYIMSSLMFMVQYAHPIVMTWADVPVTNIIVYTPNGASLQPTLGEVIGMASILLQTALMMGFVLLAIRRWRLPLGSFALLFAVNGMLMSFLAPDDPLLLVVVLYALLGFITDTLNCWLKPSAERVGALRLFAFAAPFISTAVYMLVLYSIHGEIAWSVHIWTGAIFLAGCVGVLLSYLLVPLRMPEPNN